MNGGTTHCDCIMKNDNDDDDDGCGNNEHLVNHWW